MIHRGALAVVMGVLLGGAGFPALAETNEIPRPQLREVKIVWTQWGAGAQQRSWEGAAISALKGHARGLVTHVPADAALWCPNFEASGPEGRRAFWVAFLSALARYESTHRERAVGGEGRWFGLLQIAPATARGYGCQARSGRALQKGVANLSCALRIMSQTARRDGVIHGKGDKWLGVSADWGPMRSPAKRAAIAGYTRAIPPCQLQRSLRPRLRGG